MGEIWSACWMYANVVYDQPSLPKRKFTLEQAGGGHSCPRHLGYQELSLSEVRPTNTDQY